MASDADPLRDLRAVLVHLAAEDAPQVLEQARADAGARVRAMLTDAFAQALLNQVSERAAPRPQPVGAPRSQHGPDREPVQFAEPGWYVYGVIRADSNPGANLPGVEGSQIAMVREGFLAALASRVSLEEFGEERLREHLADIGWVEAVARAHEDVLDQVRERTTVIPMRMCTVYRSEDRVREMLQREAESLEQAILDLQGKTEWGVKVFVDQARLAEATDPEGSASAAEPVDEARGVAYLKQKRRERDDREHSLQALEEAGEAIHERLSSMASDALIVPLQRPEVTGREEEMIFSGVYLVLDAAREGFGQAVRELQAQFGPSGFELGLTGPWPAYNFVPGTIGVAW